MNIKIMVISALVLGIFLGVNPVRAMEMDGEDSKKKILAQAVEKLQKEHAGNKDPRPKDGSAGVYYDKLLLLVRKADRLQKSQTPDYSSMAEDFFKLADHSKEVQQDLPLFYYDVAAKLSSNEAQQIEYRAQQVEWYIKITSTTSHFKHFSGLNVGLKIIDEGKEAWRLNTLSKATGILFNHFKTKKEISLARNLHLIKKLSEDRESDMYSTMFAFYLQIQTGQVEKLQEAVRLFFLGINPSFQEKLSKVQ